MRGKVVLVIAMTVASCFLETARAAPHAAVPNGVRHLLDSPCTVSASAVAFPGFSPLTQTGRFAQGSISYGCSSTITSIELSAGNSGNVAVRQMSGSSRPMATISYGIYLDANHTMVFGDGTAGSSAYVPSGGATSGNFTTYGAIAGGQTSVGIDSYSDTLTVTINV